MLNETLRKLNELKLYGMADKLSELSAGPKYAKFSHDEIIAFLVDHEHDRKKNNKISRLMKNAHIKLSAACIEDIHFANSRNLRKDELRDLLNGHFIEQRQNVLISGPTGAGKSYMACALANLACRNGHPALYYRVSRFLEFIKAEKALGNYLKTIEKLGKIRLLVLDDLGPDIFSKEDRNILFEIIDERHLTQATVIASQLDPDQWHALFNEPATADAICDRIFQNSHRIALNGDSMRKKIDKKKGD